MSVLKKRFSSLFLVLIAGIVALLCNTYTAYAEDTAGLTFNKITIEDASTHASNS